MYSDYAFACKPGFTFAYLVYSAIGVRVGVIIVVTLLGEVVNWIRELRATRKKMRAVDLAADPYPFTTAQMPVKALV